MPNQFFSPEGDLENYFVTEYWLIDQYVGDELWVWGRGTTSQLGLNENTNKSTPTTTFSGGNTWEQVKVGDINTFSIKSDGTLWGWGSGATLGTFDGITKSTPVTTFAGGDNWKQVSCGSNHAAAIKTDGSLWLWGNNSLVELGVNDTTNRLTPVTTFAGGNNWKQVSCSNSRTAAIKTDGSLWIWGRGIDGSLGNNVGTNRSTPITTFAGGNNWKQVSCGGFSTAAIKTDGTLWTWGRGTQGQLGNNSTTARSTPVTTFAGGTNWKSISFGGDHIAAIKTDGSLWIWGLAGSGQLGNNVATSNRQTPVTTFAGGNNWKQVSCGGFSTAAIKTNGSLWTWGTGDSGRLGDNSTIAKSTPVTTFAGGTDWKQTSVGDAHCAAIKCGTNLEIPLS
jgi:alpha-tubulin suppressor-like RCC1 family protein